MERKRARDADSLPLSAAELMRIAVDLFGTKPDNFHYPSDPFPALCSAPYPVDDKSLTDDTPHCLAGIE